MNPRKIVACALLALTLASPAFAGSIDFGLSYGAAFSYMVADSDINGISAKNNLFSYQSEFFIEGAWFSESGIGVGAGLGVVQPAFFKEYVEVYGDDKTVFPLTFKPALSFRYRIAWTRVLAVDLGAGVYIKTGAKSLGGSKYTHFEVGAEVDAALRYAPIEHMYFKAGLKASIPLWSRIWQEGGGKLTQFGIELIPSIGLGAYFL